MPNHGLEGATAARQLREVFPRDPVLLADPDALQATASQIGAHGSHVQSQLRRNLLDREQDRSVYSHCVTINAPIMMVNRYI